MDGNEAYYNDHFVIHTNIESSCYMPESNIYQLYLKKRKKKKDQEFSERREFLVMKFVEDNIEQDLGKMIVDFKLILLAYMNISSQGPLFLAYFLSFVLLSSEHCHLTFLPSLHNILFISLS